ncbi:MAG: hypothetical protein ACI9MF_001507, partial [Gammaproteobacteria bacterium]
RHMRMPSTHQHKVFQNGALIRLHGFSLLFLCDPDIYIGAIPGFNLYRVGESSFCLKIARLFDNIPCK